MTETEQYQKRESDMKFPKRGVALHGTTTARLPGILDAGLDRIKFDPIEHQSHPGIDFCIVRPDDLRKRPDLFRQAMEMCWRFADNAAKKDEERLGIRPSPVIIVFTPPRSYRMVYGGPKAYTQKRASRTNILGEISLEDFGSIEKQIARIIEMVGNRRLKRFGFPMWF